MKESILNDKWVLGINDSKDVLKSLEEKILKTAPKCKFEKTTTYQEAVEKLMSQNYDVVILDLMGIHGFDLLGLTMKRNFRVVMVTDHPLNPEVLKRHLKMGAQTCLAKEKLWGIIPLIEDVLAYEYFHWWNHLFKRLKGFFTETLEKLKDLIDEMSLYPERRLKP